MITIDNKMFSIVSVISKANILFFFLFFFFSEGE